MCRTLLLASIVAGVTLRAASPSLAHPQTAPPVQAGDAPVIVSQGESVLMLPADRAYVQIGAEGRAARPADAQRLAAAAMTSVQASLKTLGIPAEAIRTSSYSVQPQYDFAGGRQTFRDYLARNVIEVRVDDLAKLPEVIDSAGTSGAATVNSLRFDLKNRSAAELDGCVGPSGTPRIGRARLPKAPGRHSGRCSGCRNSAHPRPARSSGWSTLRRPAVAVAASRPRSNPARSRCGHRSR